MRTWDGREVPPHVELAIVSPHEHESEGHKPLWLVWKIERARLTDVPYFPELDTVCDSEDSARYHWLAATELNVKKEVWVERIPANHRFASSLEAKQVEVHLAMWKARLKQKDGD